MTVGPNSAVGSGPNKKVAKRAAAEVRVSSFNLKEVVVVVVEIFIDLKYNIRS